MSSKYIFLISFSACLVWNKAYSQFRSFSLSIDISPPVNNGATVVINRDSVYFKVTKDFGDSAGRYHAAMPPDVVEINRLPEFMNLYAFPQQAPEEKISIHKQINGRDSVTGYIYNILSDGTKVKGVYKYENATQSFQFYSLRKGDDNYNLIALIFDLLEKTFRDREAKRYIADVKRNILGS